MSFLRGGADGGAVEGANCARAGNYCFKDCVPRQGLKAFGLSRGFAGLFGEKTCTGNRKNLKSARLRGQRGDSLRKLVIGAGFGVPTQANRGLVWATLRTDNESKKIF